MLKAWPQGALGALNMAQVVPFLRRSLDRIFKFTDPPSFSFQRMADDKMIFNFKSQEDLDEWQVLSDASLGGKSSARLSVTSSGKAVFFGRTILEAPKGCAYGGYASMRLKEKRDWVMFSHSESETMDFCSYDGFEIRLRGDGRQYFFNVQMEYMKRSQVDAVWQYPLFTRGGPEWEIYRIPFNRLVETSAGYNQSRQSKLDLEKIKSLGVLVRDQVNGPFRIELDYIKVIKLITHQEPPGTDLRPSRLTSLTTDPKI